MKDSNKEIKETGKEQSTGTTGETGNQQANNSKKGACGEIIRGIEKIGDLLGGKSISTTLDYIRLYKMPAERSGADACWYLDLEKFKSWAAALGWKPTMHESDLRIQVRKKALLEAGPGTIIEGTLEHLAKRLYTDTGRLNSYMKWDDCPIEKVADFTYRLDLNKWELFQIEHRIGEYLLTGKRTKGRIAWN